MFFVNGPQALYVNPGCLKCISCLNLSPANKNLCAISFSFISCINLLIPLNQKRNFKTNSNTGILLRCLFIPKLRNNPLAC